jgi:hypothetical protein
MHAQNGSSAFAFSVSFFLLSSNKLSPISSQLVPNERTPPSIPTDLNLAASPLSLALDVARSCGYY